MRWTARDRAVPDSRRSSVGNDELISGSKNDGRYWTTSTYGQNGTRERTKSMKLLPPRSVAATRCASSRHSVSLLHFVRNCHSLSTTTAKSSATSCSRQSRSIPTRNVGRSCSLRSQSHPTTIVRASEADSFESASTPLGRRGTTSCFSTATPTTTDASASRRPSPPDSRTPIDLSDEAFQVFDLAGDGSGETSGTLTYPVPLRE